MLQRAINYSHLEETHKFLSLSLYTLSAHLYWLVSPSLCHHFILFSFVLFQSLCWKISLSCFFSLSLSSFQGCSSSLVGWMGKKPLDGWKDQPPQLSRFVFSTISPFFGFFFWIFLLHWIISPSFWPKGKSNETRLFPLSHSRCPSRTPCSLFFSPTALACPPYAVVPSICSPLRSLLRASDQANARWAPPPLLSKRRVNPTTSALDMALQISLRIVSKEAKKIAQFCVQNCLRRFVSSPAEKTNSAFKAFKLVPWQVSMPIIELKWQFCP